MSERTISIKQRMQQLHQESWPVLRDLTQDDLPRPVYSHEAEDWTVRDVLAHLADSERGILGQVQRLVAGEITVPEDFDLERWNRSAVRKRAEVDPGKLLQAIDVAYQEALSFLDQLDDQSLDLQGRHASGDILSAEGFFLRMANHRAQHAADIRSALPK